MYLSFAEEMIIGSFEKKEELLLSAIVFERSELNLLPL